jgi:hypothetical protein
VQNAELGRKPRTHDRPRLEHCDPRHELTGALAQSGVGHTLIGRHTPADNAHIERYHRTIGEIIDH